MDIADLFRFPEETEREQALLKMPLEQISEQLDRFAATVQQNNRIADKTERAKAVFAVLGGEIHRFLDAQRGKTDVFGQARDPAGFYTDFCKLQEILQEGIRRLLAIDLPLSGAPIGDLYPDWVLLRLAQGLIPDADITERAKKLLQKRDASQKRQALEDERLALLRQTLQTFLHQTVREYAERSLTLSDATNSGKSLQAGPLTALVAELGGAVDSCLCTVKRI